jgi:hypothetical protein
LNLKNHIEYRKAMEVKGIENMKSDRIVKGISIIVAVVGAVVMLGWLLDAPFLTTLLPNAKAMKFTTALCFLSSSAILYLTLKSLKGSYNLALTFLPAPCLAIGITIFTILFSSLIGINIGIENLFAKENFNDPSTHFSGRPSYGTMLNFILILFAGLIVMINHKSVRSYLNFIGIFVLIIGSSGLMGYVLNAPLLYFEYDGVSIAMAIHTAFLFVLIGTAFIIIGRPAK